MKLFRSNVFNFYKCILGKGKWANQPTDRPIHELTDERNVLRTHANRRTNNPTNKTVKFTCRNIKNTFGFSFSTKALNTSLQNADVSFIPYVTIFHSLDARNIMFFDNNNTKLPPNCFTCVITTLLTCFQRVVITLTISLMNDNKLPPQMSLHPPKIQESPHD